MSQRFRHRLSRTLRIAALLALAACLLMQPVLGAAGQVHDVFEHIDDTARHHETPEAHGGEQDITDDPIHVLLHFAHCCAPTTAVFPMGVAGVPAIDAGRILSPRADAGHPQAHPGHPFRPPISA